jgi:phytanoyl-CoA hydroxylase
MAQLVARPLFADELASACAAFANQGYAFLPQLLSSDAVVTMAARVYAIMHGDPSLPRHGFFFQHDSPTGKYEDLKFTQGFVGPSDAYRKIEKLECDPLLRQWIEHAVLRPLIDQLCPGQGGIALYRSVAWNKAAGGGTALPWHQDGGLFWGLDRPPVLQIWLALDDAPEQAGCLRVVPGTHKAGLATPQGGTIPDDVAGPRETDAVLLPARAGDVILLHNYLWHQSGVNTTQARRLAISTSYLAGDTKCTRRKRAPRKFLRLFGT